MQGKILPDNPKPKRQWNIRTILWRANTRAHTHTHRHCPWEKSRVPSLHCKRDPGCLARWEFSNWQVPRIVWESSSHMLQWPGTVASVILSRMQHVNRKAPNKPGDVVVVFYPPPPPPGKSRKANMERQALQTSKRPTCFPISRPKSAAQRQTENNLSLSAAQGN